MFAKGNWAIFGIKPTTIPTFVEAIHDTSMLVKTSQFVNSAITRQRQLDTFGINPFEKPRVDEMFFETFESKEFQVSLSEHVCELVKGTVNAQALTAFELNHDLFFADYVASRGKDFAVTDTLYAFWFVLNRWKDITHTASRKEAMAIKLVSSPYKFVTRDIKAQIDAEVASAADVERKQFPVFIDLQTHRIYAETTSKSDLEFLQIQLSQLGLGLTSLAWNFGGEQWASKFLAKVYRNTRFSDDFRKRLEDDKTFSDAEREKLDDREMEKIVSSFYATTELESSNWASLKTPAQIRLFPSMTAIGVGTPTNATHLLLSEDTAVPSSSSVVFQERVAIEKKGVEVIFREDLFTIDVSDDINMTEVGAALLKGFDVPSFVKGILREIKKTKQSPELPEFWRRWRDAMDGAINTFCSDVRETLEIPSYTPSGLVEFEPADDDRVIEEPESDELLKTRVRNGELTIELTLGGR